MTPPTVYIESVEGYPAMVMRWEHAIHSRDVSVAFRDINERLDAADEPMYVLVDLLENPQFPLLDTIAGALWGPFRHPTLNEWLVIGTNTLARVIARSLSNATRRNNIRWFSSYEEVYAYMDKMRLDGQMKSASNQS